jgi:hypothetical protein
VHKTPEITRLIHDNFWTVLSFAFGQPVVAAVIGERFHGEWKYLNKTVNERAEIRADRALLEMSTQLRVLDDEEGLNESLKESGIGALGEVTQADGIKTPLYFRDMTNKAMHAELFKWDLSDPRNPRVICLPRNGDRWAEARIDIVALMALMGALIY